MRPSQQFTQHTHHTNNPLKWASHRCAIRQYHQVNKHTTTKNCITKKRRYSRPLYSSHTTQTAHTTATHSDHAMHHFPRRHNAPDTQQTQQTKPQTHTVCPDFKNSTNYPPQGSHQTLTPPTTTRAGRATLNSSIYMGCAFLPTINHY